MRKLTWALLASVLALYPKPAFSQPRFYPPENLGPVINTSLHESDPFLAADGRKLFFVRDFDIWFAERNGAEWNTPIKLGPQINTGPGFEKSPSITPDGQRLYFVTYAGMGWDIWVCTLDSSLNDWGSPVNLGQPVNTPGAEFSAHLAPDGRNLYFTSEGAERCGTYVSEWDGFNWSVPSLVPATSCSIDEYPSITADSRWLFFERYVTSTRKNIFISIESDTGWCPPINLLPQIGDSSWTPFIVPSGDSLFFNSNRATGGYGGSDIWLARRIVLGDLNLDGNHTASDVVLELNRVFLNQPYPAPEERGDMDCDGTFGPADVVRLLLLVFQGTLPEC